MKEILKIRCHIYILIKKVIILRKIHVKIKSFAQPQKETKHIHASSADLLITVVELESAKKAVLYNVAKFRGNSCAREKTCDQLRVTGSEMRALHNESRDIDYICCGELDAMLITLAKISERKGRISPSSFFRRLPDY